MKKLLSISLLIFGMVFLANTNALAQGEIKIGGGLVFGTGVFDVDEIDNDLGIKVDGIYSFSEEFRGNVDLTYFFPKSEGDVDASLFSINLNANYIFYAEEEFTAYGLGGINIAIVTIETPEQTVPGVGTFGGSESDSEIGLNLGAGIEYQLDFADLFGELKFAGLGGDADQLVIGAGLRFGL